MSQSNVERVIGRLVTDEEFRRRFSEAPSAVLREWREGGLELTECEFRVLSAFDCQVAARCASVIDPRLQKADLTGGEKRCGSE
ncbi:MAG TPA: Os1348 family NHLP clan protein [Thermoanaerobaculia bacterium]|nr:Os1348 family NHLP clan protein [Thermoanaerobaculia bacterium]